MAGNRRTALFPKYIPLISEFVNPSPNQNPRAQEPASLPEKNQPAKGRKVRWHGDCFVRELSSII